MSMMKFGITESHIEISPWTHLGEQAIDSEALVIC